MKLKYATLPTVALAIVLTLSGCGPESPGDLRGKLQDAGAKDCDEPKHDDGEGWTGVKFSCELADVLSSTGASGVTVTAFEDADSIEVYIHDKNAWVRILDDRWGKTGLLITVPMSTGKVSIRFRQRHSRRGDPAWGSQP